MRVWCAHISFLSLHSVLLSTSVFIFAMGLVPPGADPGGVAPNATLFAERAEPAGRHVGPNAPRSSWGFSFAPEGYALWLWRGSAAGSGSGSGSDSAGWVGGGSAIPLPAGADAFLGPHTNLIVFFAFFAPAMLSMLVAAVVPVNSALLSSVPPPLRGFSMALAVVAIHLGASALSAFVRCTCC